ncbi:MAG: hypothetical protein AVDCRST_MAG68-5523, partial [uncultured Gemmatimonadetes bacterium]
APAHRHRRLAPHRHRRPGAPLRLRGGRHRGRRGPLLGRRADGGDPGPGGRLRDGASRPPLRPRPGGWMGPPEAPALGAPHGPDRLLPQPPRLPRRHPDRRLQHLGAHERREPPDPLL